ncbi:MAG: tRNA 2-thiouridine(34) synthase MnmA [Minisyncoccia bacterium]
MKKVFVLMSGGVDSSVSALLLKKRGFNVVGIHLKLSKFCDPKDEYDARRTAEIIDIPFYVIDITEEYQKNITLDLIKNYALGYTPNPDALCNKLIKFGFVYDKLKNLGFDYIATGHYAKIKNNLICIPKDKEKDQTYFLWPIKKEKIKKILFPLGDYTKSEVREIARKYNLPNADKKDSQGICFLGKIRLVDFLKEYLPENPGLIVDKDNNILGYHKGYYFFTEGQRHGLDIKKGDGPYFVALKDKKENKIVVAKEDDDILYSRGIELKDLNLFIEPRDKIDIFVRCRYRQPLVRAIFDFKDKKVIFEEPIKAIAPGQSAVFYKDEFLIGGGIIKRRW